MAETLALKQRQQELANGQVCLGAARSNHSPEARCSYLLALKYADLRAMLACHERCCETPIAMNSFTDEHPEFPYQSSAAHRQLGVPSSPVIHLAITTLAEQLLPLAGSTGLDDAQSRILALRVASDAALFGWSLPEAEQHVRIGLDRPCQDGVKVPTHRIRIPTETDWLGSAAARLEREGVHVDQRFQQQRTNHGWRELPGSAPERPPNS
jgi:hypothetical protein